MSTPIDLGRASEFGGGSIATPINDRDRVYYPEFTYSGDKELELPEEGEMVIKFRTVRETEDVREGRYTCTVEVLSIEKVKGEKDNRPSKRDTSAEDALDTLAKAFGKDKESY
jgi:hypothetical protein